MLGEYSALWSYVNQDNARLTVRVLQLQQQETRIANELYRERPRLMNVEKWRRDAVISEDDGIELIRQQIVNANSELEYVRSYLANYDKYINALSRELTRKMHETQLPRQ